MFLQALISGRDSNLGPFTLLVGTLITELTGPMEEWKQVCL